MKKLFNFRSFVYSTVFIMLSIFTCVLAMNIGWLGLTLLFILIFAPPVIVAILRYKIADYKIVTVILTSILCVISAVSFMVKVYTWIPFEIVQNRDYYIEGTVDDWYEYDDFKVAILKDLTIGINKVPGNLQLAVFNSPDFDDSYIGNRFKFTTDLQLNTLISDYHVNSVVLQSNIRYLASANIKNIQVEVMRPDFLSSVKIFIKNKLVDNMGKHNGSVAYGILTGNKNGISDEIHDAFIIAGVAHILAVSGLHIGFLMAAIMFILKLLKVKRKPSFFISSGILILYAFLAGFSPSVTRAVIMCIIGGGAEILGQQKDSLNSLGIAASAILTFAPFMLFDVGFIMSVGAVFSIINFTPVFTRGLKKLELPEKMCKALSVSASAQLGILPADIYIFGVIQTYSILINIILMPLMSLAFMLTFVTLLISLIPPFGFLLAASGAIIEVLIAAAEFCATLPLAQIGVSSSPIIMFLYPFYFMIGDFCNFDHKKELAFFGGLIFFLFAIFLILL